MIFINLFRNLVQSIIDAIIKYNINIPLHKLFVIECRLHTKIYRNKPIIKTDQIVKEVISYNNMLNMDKILNK